MIPKKIHYCWFGGAEKPTSVLACIESWKKYCPDYEIIEWNESNYDFKKNDYMYEAYKSKVWGFVPDYARLDIIYNNGGIYLDTDVEVINCFDALLCNKSFFGFESNSEINECYVNCGQGFGGEKGNNTIKLLRDDYENVHFVNNDGSLNKLPSPRYTTKLLVEFGLKQDNRDQFFSDFTVYKSDVMCPKDYANRKVSLTSRSVSIHHFDSSWMSGSEKALYSIKTFLSRNNLTFLVNLYSRISKIYNGIIRKLK